MNSEHQERKFKQYITILQSYNYNRSFLFITIELPTKGLRPNMINTSDLNSINELSYTA